MILYLQSKISHLPPKTQNKYRSLININKHLIHNLIKIR